MATKTFNPSEFVNTVRSIYSLVRNVLTPLQIKYFINATIRMCDYDVDDVYLFLQVVMEKIKPDWQNCLPSFRYDALVKSYSKVKKETKYGEDDDVIETNHPFSIRLRALLKDSAVTKGAGSSEVGRNILCKALDESSLNLQTYIIDLALDRVTGWFDVLDVIIRMSYHFFSIPTLEEVMSRRGTVVVSYGTTSKSKPSVPKKELPVKTDPKPALPKVMTVTTKTKGHKRNADKRIPVVRYTLDGVLVDEFESQQEAALITQSNRSKINRNINGHLKSVRSKVDGLNYIYKLKSDSAA